MQKSGVTVKMCYVNYKGILSKRTVIVDHFHSNKNEWHEGPQMHGFDIEKNAFRDFALTGIQHIETISGGLK